MEEQTGFNFYFDTARLTSLIININVNKQPLPDVLRLAFANTPITFSYDVHHNFFITKGQIVQTELPNGFFGNRNEKSNALPENNIIDYPDVAPKVQNATQQNKLYPIGAPGASNTQARSTVTGFILDNKTGEPVIGASVHVEKTTIDVITDQYGYYTISLPKGRHTISIQSVGMKDTRRELQVNGDGKFNIEMQTQVVSLKNVVVSAEKASNIRNLQMGVQKIDIKTIKQVPVVFW